MPLRTIDLPEPASLAAAVAALRQADAGDRVLLALPPVADELAHRVRLDILRRQADAYGVQVALATTDRDIRYFAGVARIPVFADAAEAEKLWRYPKPAPALPPAHRFRPFLIPAPAQVGLGATGPDIVTRPGGAILVGALRRRRWQGVGTFFTLLFVAAALAAMVFAFAVYVLPQATVTMTPAAARLVNSVELTGQVGIDEPSLANQVVPARSVQARVEGFGETASTGTEFAPSQKATGRVTFINATVREVQVSEGTIVRTRTGNNVRFRVTSPVAIPAGNGQRADAFIEALAPGREGNVPAFTVTEIEGPLQLSAGVTNQSPTGGGTVENVPTVIQADKDRLLGQMQADLQKQAYEQLASGLRQGEYIPPETVQTFTLAETYDRFAGEHSDKLGLQLQLLARGLAVDLGGAKSMAERMVRESVPAGHFLLENTLTVGQPSFRRFTEETVEFTLTATAEALLPIQTAEVRRLVVGLRPDEAVVALQQRFQLATPPIIKIEPSWLSRLPIFPTRIKVNVYQSPDEVRLPEASPFGQLPQIRLK